MGRFSIDLRDNYNVDLQYLLGPSNFVWIFLFVNMIVF